MRYTFETNKRKRIVGLENIFVATWTLKNCPSICLKTKEIGVKKENLFFLVILLK